jgi:predicted GNAT family N-acyltransferase
MKYIYISNKTKDNFNLIELPSTNILQSYKNIKKSNNKWGMFLFDKEKIIGVCEVMEEEEKGITFLLIVYIFIEKEYRGKNLCYEILKRTILKKKRKMLIKAVIAGGESILKCLIKVFKELNYKIQKYKSDKIENIKQLKFITSEEAIKIEKKNFKTDVWQTLFFCP